MAYQGREINLPAKPVRVAYNLNLIINCADARLGLL
jgi:hypothetical protein